MMELKSMGRMTSHKLCFNCWVDKKNVAGIPTPLKNMSSSVGMMKFPMYGKYKKMFQTTNQEFTVGFMVDVST